jgi:hypothetical protein
MHQQLWGYKVEEKLYLGVREQTRLNITDLHHAFLLISIKLRTCVKLNGTQPTTRDTNDMQYSVTSCKDLGAVA